jgi:hypothetical protein
MDYWRATKSILILFDEPLLWPYFHSICAPSKFTNRRGITSTNQVHPECLVDLRGEFDYLDREFSVSHIFSQLINESVDMVNYRRGFD